MFKMISKLTRTIALSRSRAPTTGVAHNLMERAEAGAGRDPHEARELRDAARAFLSVVR